MSETSTYMNFENIDRTICLDKMDYTTTEGLYQERFSGPKSKKGRLENIINSTIGVIFAAGLLYISCMGIFGGAESREALVKVVQAMAR